MQGSEFAVMDTRTKIVSIGIEKSFYRNDFYFVL